MKKAFTLAEVLITLGIIGVVSAMTIPTLVANYNTKSWSTAAKVFERKLDEALRTMNSQSSLSGHESTKSFVDELSQHFKINKICTNNELENCFASTVYWGTNSEEVDLSEAKTSSDFGLNNWGSELIGVQFANGVTALIAYNRSTTGAKICSQDPYSNTVVTSNCLAILYDTSGMKNPNTSGKDMRSINVESLGGNSCAFEISGTCFRTPKRITSWDDAVATCGGAEKLPTRTQLDELAKDLYNLDTIDRDTFTQNVNWDPEKVSAYGFDTSSEGFALWSGEEYNSTSVYGRAYTPTATSDWGYSDKINPAAYAICLN